MIDYKNISRTDNSLRPYQQEAKNKIFSAWDNVDNIMFQMPTGTGKTRLFTSIISDIKTWSVVNSIDVKILIIAHRVELIEQISESLSKYRIPHGLIAGGKPRDLLQYVQVASIQTLNNVHNINAVKDLNVDYVIIDEAHHSTANSYKKLWQLYPESKKLGVTATPWRMNASGFTSLYDQLIISKSIKEFIKEGWLASYNYYSIKQNSQLTSNIDNIDEFDVEGDYKISALERVVDQESIRAQLLENYLKFAKGKKGIIYSISRRHSDHICDEFKSAGVNIVRIDSETPRDERRLYVKRFKEGKIDIIVNVDIFSEGFDCPDIEFIQLARPTKSLVKYLQQVGRGLRPTASKSHCIILDNVGLHIKFGLPDADQTWLEHFNGDPTLSQKGKRSRDVKSIETAPRERNFDEGTDDMVLIDGITNEEKPIELENRVETYQWTEKDDALLTTLYTERKCPTGLIVSVFQLDENQIIERLKNLNLYEEN